MIVDHLQNAHHYYGLGPRFERALRWLADTDLGATAPERHPLDGDDVFALVQEYQSKAGDEGFWEAHRKYADVQYVVSGVEDIGYAPAAAMEAGPYDEGRDFLKLEGEGTFLEMPAGYFMILFPQDAHMPGMALRSPAPVKKAVVKVRL
ncbi:MAG: YhcH/YjgK/YiaL family protein [Gemmatimonadota bacterium]